MEPSTGKDKIYYAKLQRLLEDINFQEVDGKEDILRSFFSRVYDFVILQNDDYSLLDNNMVIYEDAFDVCFFMSLCMFLYETKRLKGKSLRKFIYDHSPRGYNIKGSPNYFDYESMSRNFRESNSDKPEGSSTLINSDDAKLRQFQKRLRVQRPVHHDSTEWSAMRMVSEHEWTLHFFMNEENDLEPSKDDDEETKKELERQANERKRIRDTYKRIRNLYTDIYKAINSKMDDKYIERLDTAAEKYCSTLNKLQYEHYLELGKFCLDYISKEKMKCFLSSGQNRKQRGNRKFHVEVFCFFVLSVIWMNSVGVIQPRFFW